MNQSCLHIFNGDSTLERFKKTAIVGDQFVWREILCEGPSLVDLDSKSFWELRNKYISALNNLSFNTMHDQLVDDFLSLDLSPYTNILLWFEYDLFCQINLIALLSWLLKKNISSSAAISLICPGDHPNYDKRVGLGELTTTEFITEFENKITLSRADLELAHSIWEVYCSDHHDSMMSIVEVKGQSQLVYLEDALLEHEKRFPNISTGLTEIEHCIVEYIKDHEVTAQQIVGMLLKRRTNYGFGDLQYFEILTALSDLFVIQDDLYYLNQSGTKILSGDLNYSVTRQRSKLFGGSAQQSFVQDSDQSKLVRRNNS